MPKAGPDSRLLENLLKAERTAQESFKQWTKDASAASVALSAWAVADSGETPDLMETSMRIGTLLGTCAESQRTYLDALTSYRASLKDVLMRESDIRTILRDREILVSRLIALSKKKPGESGRDLHAARLEEAKRELGACEATLKAEEFGLMGVKRRVLRDAFGMRMRSLGELGCVLEDSAKAAIELLDQLGADPRPEGQPAFDDFRANINQALTGDDTSDIASPDGSIAPSQSASQVARRAAGYPPSQSDNSTDEYDVHIPPPHMIGGDAGVFPTAAKRQSGLVNGTRNNHKAPLPDVEETGSSDEEPQNVVAHRGGGADLGRTPKSTNKKSKTAAAAKASSSDSGSSATARGQPAQKAPSETGSRSGGGFFSAFTALFKNRPKRRNSFESYDTSGGGRRGWSTRTDANVKEAKRNIKPAGNSGGSRIGTVRRRRGSSDDERPDPRSLVRVVNSGGPPLWRDSGVVQASAMPAVTPKRQRRASIDIAAEIYNPPMVAPRKRATSEIGVSTAGAGRPGIMRKPKTEESPLPGAGGLSRSGTVTSTMTSTTTGTVKRKKKRVVSSPPPALPVDGTTQPGQKVIGSDDSRFSTSTWVAKPTARANQQASLMSLIASPPSPGLATESTSRKYGPGETAEPSTSKKLKKKRVNSSLGASPTVGSVTGASPAAAPAAAAAPANTTTSPSANPIDTLVLPTAPPRVSASDFGPKPPVLALPTAPPRVAGDEPPVLSNGAATGTSLAPPVPGAGAELGRRKSVRIADEGASASPSHLSPARGPTPILRAPSPTPAATVLAQEDQQQQQAAVGSKKGEWESREAEEVSSDEDDQGAQSMSAYAKARRAMNKSAQAIEEAGGMSEVAKGKQRAV